MNGFRHELKYIINMQEYALLKMRLGGALERDPHAGESGVYTIRSLYFDDYWKNAYQEKETGVYSRRKYRLRLYNYDGRVIHLERKLKVGQYIKKEIAAVDKSQAEAILGGDHAFLLKSGQELLKEFYYECVSNVMRPRVIVDYEREPFIMDAGTVRITFDRHIRAGSDTGGLFDPELACVDVISGDRLVMEVKFTQLLPKYVTRLLNGVAGELQAASKYTMCCDACVGASFMDRAEGIIWKTH